MTSYVYTYACHEDEAALCALERRKLFSLQQTGQEQVGYVASSYRLDPSRSPFLKRRMEQWLEGDSLDAITSRLPAIELEGETFKVSYMPTSEKPTYEEQRNIERVVGAAIRGTARMKAPEQMFAITCMEGRWLFGPCVDSEAIWLRHQQKPQNYSTALGTRVARAIVNIAFGRVTDDIRAIDPCCGMGTVLIEALSMGAEIAGVDRNPLAVRGARVNLAHFGYSDHIVSLGDMTELTGSYDAAIVDMPYNLCSVLPIDEQLAMLRSVRRLARYGVIVTTTPIEQQLDQAAFRITDRCQLHKGSFTRYITVVE